MILSLLKNKPRLRDLIPDGFVDIHSHILPGIDDGAKDINESKLLVNRMMDMGFSKIYGTPHTYEGLYNNTSDSIKKSFEKVKKSIKNGLEINYASEYMIDYSILKRIHNNSLLTLKENYVLLEMSFISAPNDLYEIIYELKLKKYKPILAHPERYRFLFNNFNEYFKLKKVGCMFQINMLSVTGYYGKDVTMISDKLLKKNLIDFAGSDIHNINHIKKFDNKIKIKEVDKFIKSISANSFFK
tara:strand:+ start:1876 stop:2604 length:729 start_codon:yes stop_codon:yes gene_type:complete